MDYTLKSLKTSHCELAFLEALKGNEVLTQTVVIKAH